MEAEARHFRARRLAGLQQRIFGGDVDFLAVDDDLAHFATARFSTAAAASALCPAKHFELAAPCEDNVIRRDAGRRAALKAKRSSRSAQTEQNAAPESPPRPLRSRCGSILEPEGEEKRDPVHSDFVAFVPIGGSANALSAQTPGNMTGQIKRG